MASSDHKHYHDEELDPKEFVESHFSHGNIDIIEDSTVFPVRVLHELFSSGKVKGNKLLDISIGATVYQLFSACNVFSDIYVMEFSDAHIKHFKQWLEKGDKATDWSFVSKYVCELQGNRDGWLEQEEKLKTAIKCVFLWDIFTNSSIDPLLVPKVDCVLSLYVINVISKTKEDFQMNLKRLTAPLKIGGYLVLITVLNMSFYVVGKHKFFVLAVDEDFVRNAVTNAGFVIEKDEKRAATVKSKIVDFEHIFVILARKEREF